jgi:hypothetical protein
MQWRSIVIGATLVAGLGLGIVVGPTVRGSVASAQTQPPAQTQPAAGGTLRNLFLDQLAASLKISRATLDTAITSAGNSTADAAVQQGTLTQAQADALKARIAAGDLGALWGGHGGGPGGPRMGGAAQKAMIEAAAKTLTITSDELVKQLRSGQTLAQLAQAHSTTEQAVINAALAAAKTQLNQEVSSGALTQAQADAIYAQLQQRGAQLFSPPRGPGHGDRGRPGAPQTPQMPTTAPAT